MKKRLFKIAGVLLAILGGSSMIESYFAMRSIPPNLTHTQFYQAIVWIGVFFAISECFLGVLMFKGKKVAAYFALVLSLWISGTGFAVFLDPRSIKPLLSLVVFSGFFLVFLLTVAALFTKEKKENV